MTTRSLPEELLDTLADIAKGQPLPEPDHDAIERERQREQERRIAAARVRVANLAQSMIANGTDRVLIANAMVLAAQRLLQDADRLDP